MHLKIIKTDKDLTTPTYAHPTDAGLDLRSTENVVIKPKEVKTVGVGIKIALPPNTVGLIWDKSGYAVKYGIHCLAGVIDEGYRGELSCTLINLGHESFVVKYNMKIAQLIIQPVIHAKLIEVETLDESERGEGKFGSTGRF